VQVAATEIVSETGAGGRCWPTKQQQRR
jgi:hypothetical protein